jgi:integrase
MEAERRGSAVAAFVASYFDAMRSSVVTLSHRQTLALAGLLYAAWAGEPDKQPAPRFCVAGIQVPAEPPSDYKDEAYRLVELANRLEALSGLEHLEGTVDALLSYHGLPQIDTESRARLLAAMASAVPIALRVRARYALGDYSRDDNLSRFPAWEPWTQRKQTDKLGNAQVSLKALVKEWEAEARSANLAQMTIDLYTGVFARLGDFLEHDDAARITHEDLIRYKDFRLTKINPKSGRVLKASSFKTLDLAAFNNVLGWAATNKKLASNPAVGLTVKVPKKTKVRDKEFTEEEAQAILRATPEWRKEDEAFYWVPWLCAYSGCRVGEAMQLRKEDIRQVAGAWVMKITPEAGTVKTKEFREVPLHAHILELGFSDYVEQCKAGHLFVHGGGLKAIRNKVSMLTKRVRDIVTDPHVSPNHGWRHTFKHLGFEVGVQEKVLDAICGHAPRTEGGKYGSVSLKTKLDAIERFPRFFPAPQRPDNILSFPHRDHQP